MTHTHTQMDTNGCKYIYIYIYIYKIISKKIITSIFQTTLPHKNISRHTFKERERVLYVDFRPGQTYHSKDAEVAYFIGVGRLGWQYGTIWDCTRGTAIDWCTGREWPVNCMTVISARWQSNMPFQRQRKWHISDGKLWGDIEWAIELLYNSVKTGSRIDWRPVGEKMLEWEHVLERQGHQALG